jgi:hypothetical protein
MLPQTRPLRASGSQAAETINSGNHPLRRLVDLILGGKTPETEPQGTLSKGLTNPQGPQYMGTAGILRGAG